MTLMPGILSSLKNKWIWASQLNWSYASENTPFFDLPYISSPKQARGFNDRRYINHQLLSLQTELRFDIYKRLKGVGFITANSLPDDLSQVFSNDILVSYGIGLRFVLDPLRRTRFRLDVASDSENINFYFTVNEAF